MSHKSLFAHIADGDFIPDTALEWVLMPIALFFAVAIPLFILAPLITGTVKPLIDDWIGMNK
ncbi:hypothetical protein EVB41_025 [Rhizobium phage RHph_TM3_14A]|nr:hypothetical protein EVB29_025 [Rhizobium phage RHph_TM27A]QIG66945.1 hypothetical protein EVB30_025 [Rhizobium phage RHph_TM27B]QIG67035.1 hypothetical protein EVB31_025 [Rhizobium phage RHph_TM29]QIG67490.1 hypothetical protein EVB41_025 [Rhizobium phage RHph_TM3_14A]